MENKKIIELKKVNLEKLTNSELLKINSELYNMFESNKRKLLNILDEQDEIEILNASILNIISNRSI